MNLFAYAQGSEPMPAAARLQLENRFYTEKFIIVRLQRPVRFEGLGVRGPARLTFQLIAPEIHGEKLEALEVEIVVTLADGATHRFEGTQPLLMQEGQFRVESSWPLSVEGSIESLDLTLRSPNRGSGGTPVPVLRPKLHYRQSLEGVAPERAPTQVILVTLDTFRADSLGIYGNSLSKTPNFDTFAAEATRFTDCYSTANVTRPSHFSIFASMFLKDHGVDTNHERLSDEVPTLIDVLRRKGFRTAAFVGAANFSSLGSDFYQRFDDFHACEPRDRRAEDVNADAVPWLVENRDRDFFAWIHYFDTHAPYAPPYPYNRMYQERDELRGPSPVSPDYDWLTLKREASPDVLRKLYLGEVSYLDSQFGALLAVLREVGIYDTSTVVVVADHGDALGEFGFWALHSGLSDGTTHVPLLIKAPGGEPRGVVRGLVSTVDIYPTIFDLLGLEIPHPHRGESLLPLMIASRDSERKRVFSEHAHGYQAAIRTPRHRAILGLETHRFGRSSQGYRVDEGRVEIYDYEAGRLEHDDIAPRAADLASRFRDEIEEFLRDHYAFEATPIEDEQYIERLKALGYAQ